MSDVIIWEKYDNYILSDISLSLIDKVKVFLLKHYVEENIICQMIRLKDEQDYDVDHSQYLDHLLPYRASLVVLDEKTDEIVAAVMMKPMTKEMRSWTVIRLISKNRKLNSLLSITRQMLSQADQFDNGIGSMHIFELCVPQNSTLDWVPILFHGAYRVAQSMKLPIITFTGFTQKEQAAATAAGFTELARLFYPTYTEMGGHRPIPPSDVGEMYAMLYYKEVEPYVPYYELP